MLYDRNEALRIGLKETGLSYPYMTMNGVLSAAKQLNIPVDCIRALKVAPFEWEVFALPTTDTYKSEAVLP